MLPWWEQCKLPLRATEVFLNNLIILILSQKENTAINLKQCIAKIKAAFAAEFNPYVTIKKAGCKKKTRNQKPALSNCHIVKFIHFILTSLSNLKVVQQLSFELPKP